MKIFFFIFSLALTGIIRASSIDLEARLKSSYLVILNGPQSHIKEINAWLRELDGDAGTFRDIDYKKVDSNDFEPSVALSRARIFSLAVSFPGHDFFGDPKLKRASAAIVRHWLKHDFQSYNWWHNTIGVPGYLVPIALFIRNELTEADLAAIEKVLRRGVAYGNSRNFTAQNKLWYADIEFGYGVLFNDDSKIQSASKKVISVIVKGMDEGIQDDNSFFQHGPLVYNGGYGASFAQNIAKFAMLLSNTAWEFGQNHYEILDGLLLDGTRNMMWKNFIDISVTGREFVRPHFGPSKILSAATMMATTSSSRSEEYHEWVKVIKGLSRPKRKANTMFFLGDMMTHLRPEFYASARAYSRYTFNVDAPSNGEGIMSHNLADGALFIYRTGEEFDKIYPVLDWRMIPGTTSVLETIVPARYIPNVSSGENMRTLGRSTILGGVSDGEYGAMGFEFEKPLVRYNLKARKSWFFFDEGVVALGSDISCAGCRSSVVTTLQQSLAKGDGRSLEGAGVYHDKTAYIPLDGKEIKFESGEIRGSWRVIDQSGSSEEIKKDIFKAWVSHGNNPSSAGYAYVVLPEISELKAQKFRESGKISDWTTANGVHGVAFDNNSRIQAIIYNEGASATIGGVTIWSDSPVAVSIIQKISHDYRVIVSSLDRRKNRAVLKINGTPISVSFDRKYPGKPVSL